MVCELYLNNAVIKKDMEKYNGYSKRLSYVFYSLTT